MSLINHRRRSDRWHGASQKVGQTAAPLFLDRIDIQCKITPVPFKDISKAAQGEPSAEIRKRVIRAREIQAERFSGQKGIHCNAQISERMIHPHAENGHGTSVTICPRLQPHPEGSTHHCRPGRLRTCRVAPLGRGHRLSHPRPWRLG